MSLRLCIEKAGKLVSPEDGEMLLSKAQELVKDGYDADRAAIMSVTHYRDEAFAALNSVYKQIGLPEIDKATGQPVIPPPPPEPPPAPPRELKTKPADTVKPEPEKPTLRAEIQAKAAEKQSEIDAIKAQLDAIAKEVGVPEWNPSGPESGFTLNPLDLIGIVDRRQIPLLAQVAKLSVEAGALKFADFSLFIIEKLGKNYTPFIASLYEATRNYFKSIADNFKLSEEERSKAKTTLDKMTPIDAMADEIITMDRKMFGDRSVKIYSSDHVIKVEDVDIESRGTRDRSAIGRNSPDAEALWEESRQREKDRLSKLSARQAEATPPLPAWSELSNYAKDGFINSLTKRQQEKIRAKQSEVVEPAFFVPKQKNFDKLSKQLLSDSSPPGGKYANSLTYRLVDILDRETGKVHRVSVFENNRKPYVTIFDESVRPKGVGHKETDRAVSLKDVLSQKDRFTAIGSIRTKGLTEYYHEVFADQKTYRDTFSRDVSQRQKAVEAVARAEQQKMEAYGIESGADYRERLDDAISKAEINPGDTGSIEAPSHAIESQIPERAGTLAAEPGTSDIAEGSMSEATPVAVEHKPGKLNLDANDVRVLRDEFPGFETVDDLREMLASPHLLSDNAFELIEKIAAQDVYFFRHMAEDGLEQTLKDYGYADTGKGKPLQQGTATPKEGDISTAGSGREGRVDRPGTSLAGEQDRIGQAQGEQRTGEEGAGTGNAIPDQASGVKFNQPDPSSKTESELHHEQLLNSIHSAAADAGIDVQTSKGERSGMYDPANRTLTQVVGETVGRQDVKTAFHEVAHDVFSNEMPEVQDSILKAIDSLSDKALGVDTSSDPRIRSNDPSGLGRRAVNEERLVEATAERLVREGFDPAEAKGFAQRFVRALKDFYYKAVMEVQKMFKQSSNPELARRYFENRVKQLLSGDTSRMSYQEWLRIGKPSVAARQREWFSRREFAERFDNGSVVHDHEPDLSLAASRFNSDSIKYNLPEAAPLYTRTNEIEKRVAVLNHLDELQKRAAEAVEANPELKTRINSSKKGTLEWMRSLLKLSDPKESLKELEGWTEPGGNPVKYDATKTIEGFKGKSNVDAVLTKAFRNAQAFRTRVAKAAHNAVDTIAILSKKRDDMRERHDKQAKEYKDYEGQTTQFRRSVFKDVKDLFNSIAGLSKKSGVIEQQLKSLDPTRTLKDYAPVFENLVKNNALGDQKLFDVLDTAANDATIDFTKPVNEVRDAMLASHVQSGNPYDLLLKDTPESKALLATVVAFAKTHARTMAELELRREKSGEKRAEIEDKLADLAARKKAFGSELRELSKTAKLEERARRSYFESVKRMRQIDRAITRERAKIDAAESILPVVDSEVSRLTGKLDAAPDFVFRDGAEYLVAKPGMSSAEVVERNKDGSLKNLSKLTLDSTRKATDPRVVNDHLLGMKEWIDERDSAARNGDDSAHDGVYQSVKRSYQELAAHIHYNLAEEPSQRWMLELAFMPVFKRLREAFGTPASQAVDRIGNLYERVRSTLTRDGVNVGHKTMQLEDEILKLAPMTRERLREDILNPAKALLQYRTRDLAEMYAGQPERIRRAAYDRVREMLTSNKATRDLVSNNIDRIMPSLEKLIEHQHDANKRQIAALESGIQVYNPFTGKYENSGVGVLDPKLKVFNPITGKMESAIRRHVDVGPWTFSQRMHRNFSLMLNALRNSDWASFDDVIGKAKPETENTPAEPGLLAKAYAESPEAARALVNKFLNHAEHGDQVRESFFRALAEMPEEAGFESPAMADGVTRPPADPELVRESIEASGTHDLVGFAERLFDLHNAEGSKADYVQEIAERMNDYFKQADTIERQYNPGVKEGSVRSLRGMTPDAMINARELESLPGSWFDYHDFDQRDMFRMSERIASEIAFGRGQERLASLVDTIGKEAEDARLKLESERSKVKRANPSLQDRKVEEIVRKNLGDGYQKLKNFEKRQSLVGKSAIQLSDYFRRDYSPEGTLRTMTRAGQFLGNLMVNNPGSAIYQMAQLFDTVFRYGVSPASLTTTGTAIKRAVHESVASLAQAIGIQMGNGSEFHERYVRLGLNDPAVANRFRDSFDRWQGESAGAFGLRAASEITQAGINPLGEASQHTVFRPAGIFSMSTIIADRALTDGIWKLAERFVAKGLDYYKDNASKLEDATHSLSHDDLGLASWNGDRISFEKLKKDMERWGMNYDDMVRGAARRSDKTIITDEEAMRLHSMAMSEISSQANLATMTPAAWNNSVIRFMVPLLGWSIRRTLDVSSKRLDINGKMSAKAMAQGMAALAVISTGGLALSALVDQYYEDILGKKRNLRPILTPGGLLEHSARLGQTGLFGELANGALNVGTGGDNRIVSLDRRVVAVSAFMTVQSAISAMVNQGEADYAHVVRPLVAAMGGGGALQYMQMANRAFGLNNVEAQINVRMNAQNYLRVVGRELNLDVRSYGGGAGYSNVTPMTPYLTRMELAAYSDDAVSFRIAYKEAIAKAKAQGYPDPVDQVKRSFAAKNPLRVAFQTSPSEADYRRILNALPSDGRRDVSNAVGQFNRYAESIGARGFEGKIEKTQPSTIGKFPSMPSPTRVEAFRKQALSNR